jgi:hypothetical protein
MADSDPCTRSLDRIDPHPKPFDFVAIERPELALKLDLNG